MTTKEDVREALQGFLSALEEIVEKLPPAEWERGVYENGWNAKQILAHMASTAGIAGFVLTLARTGPVVGRREGDSDFDNDAFNAQQVTAREKKTVEALLNEIRDTLHRDGQVVTAAPDQLLASAYEAPWGEKGTVAYIIAESFNRHLGGHVNDLKSAVAST
jgi:hypothetical protein